MKIFICQIKKANIWCYKFYWKIIKQNNFDNKSQNQLQVFMVVTERKRRIKIIGLILKCIDVSGLNGIDLQLSQHLSKAVKDIVKTELNQENRNIIDTLIKQQRLFTTCDENYYDKVYKQLAKQFRPLITKILYPFKQIGQLNNLRKLTYQPNDVYAQKHQMIQQQMISSTASLILLWKLILKLKWKTTCCSSNKVIQLTDFIRKIYAQCEMPEHTPLILALMIMHQLPQMDFDQKLNSLVKKSKDSKLQYEPNCLLMRIIKFLNQFNQLHSFLFVSYLGQSLLTIQIYIKSTIFFMLQSKELQKQPEIFGDFFMLLTVIEEIFRINEDNYENFKQLISYGLFKYLKREMIIW